MKQCYKCKEIKELSEFHKDMRRRDGLFPYCRKCRTKTGKPRTRKERYNHSNGYILLSKPGHPLAQKGGYLYEHRYVVYKKYGNDLPNCELCGKQTSWEPYTTHIDHIDKNKSNNDISNLRVLCNACNSRRDLKPSYTRSGTIPITYFDLTLTASEWAKFSFVQVSGNCVRHRIRRGYSPEMALIAPPETRKRKPIPKIKDIKAEIDRYRQLLRDVGIRPNV